MTNEELTQIYHEANGIVGKNPPITTERIFTAMRAAMSAERGRCLAAIGAIIKEGELTGNGFDKTAERNGLVLAQIAVAGL